jgi:hypothetical protein
VSIRRQNKPGATSYTEKKMTRRQAALSNFLKASQKSPFASFWRKPARLPLKIGLKGFDSHFFTRIYPDLPGLGLILKNGFVCKNAFKPPACQLGMVPPELPTCSAVTTGPPVSTACLPLRLTKRI